jgi:hypothetical protein
MHIAEINTLEKLNNLLNNHALSKTLELNKISGCSI